MDANKKTIIYVAAALAVIVIACVLLRQPDAGDRSAGSSLSGKMTYPSSARSLKGWLPSFLATPQKEPATKGDHRIGILATSNRKQLNKIPTASNGLGSETPTTVTTPSKTSPITMEEEIRTSLGENPAKDRREPANALPTDAEIEAGIKAQNQKDGRLDYQLAKRQAEANRITSEIRSLSPEELSPNADPNNPAYHSPVTSPPEDLIQAVKSRRYIAH